jgi:sugar lactone lactonase YvrE
MVLSTDGPEGTVYSFKPGSPETGMTVIPPTATSAQAGIATAIPANYWNNGEFTDQYDPKTDRFTTLAEMFARDIAAPTGRHYVSPDGSVALPAHRTFSQGPSWRWSPAMQTYGFVTAKPGSRVFVSNGSEVKTYSGLLAAGGAITDLKPFANRGGESVAEGPDGRVYVANGQVFVYAADGKEVGRIDVPERPLQLLFGGPDRRTLFILTHHALYSARP